MYLLVFIQIGSLHGVFQDATPFTFHEKHRVVDYVGEQLRSAHHFDVASLYI